MGKSSKDKRDAYYRLAKEQGWRARSAFKLLQLDEEFDLFAGVHRVVDLCAAPGSWSQVLSRVLIKGERIGRSAWEDKRYHELLRLKQNGHLSPEMSLEVPPPAQPRKDVKIVAIDLQPMSPLEGITCLKADITHPSTIPMLLKALDPDYNPTSTSIEAAHPVDLVLSDGAPDVTGLHDLDIYVQSQLLWAALNLALCVLKSGGRFVAKIFRGKDVDLLYAQLKIVFEGVTVAKPRSSRASSVEAFIVCTNFRPPAGFKASLDSPLGGFKSLQRVVEHQEASSHPSRRVRDDGITELDLGPSEGDPDVEDIGWIAPFLACGDLSAFDADASHKLPEEYVSLDPVQPPTAPPYRKALEQRKKMGGAYGKTKIGTAKLNCICEEIKKQINSSGIGLSRSLPITASQTLPLRVPRLLPCACTTLHSTQARNRGTSVPPQSPSSEQLRKSAPVAGRLTVEDTFTRMGPWTRLFPGSVHYYHCRAVVQRLRRAAISCKQSTGHVKSVDPMEQDIVYDGQLVRSSHFK